MKDINQPFEIEVKLLADESSQQLRISHATETFDFDLGHETCSIINNGDNSWSLVKGALTQEDVNLIGNEIEKHFQTLSIS